MSTTERDSDDWVWVKPLDDTPPLVDRIDTAADQQTDTWPAAEPGEGTEDWEIPDGRTHARNARYAIQLPTDKGIEWIDLAGAGRISPAGDDAALIVARGVMDDLEEVR